MSVSLANQYKVTKHLKERLESRFNLRDESEIKKWTLDLLKRATLVSEEEGNKQKWRYGDIFIILDEAKKVIITIWNDTPEDVKLTSSQTNPELKIEITNTIEAFNSRKKRKMASDIIPILDEINFIVHNMDDPKANFRYIDSNYDKFVESFIELSREVDKTRDIIKESTELIL